MQTKTETLRGIGIADGGDRNDVIRSRERLAKLDLQEQGAGKHVRGLTCAADAGEAFLQCGRRDSNFAANSPAMRRRDRGDGGAKYVIAHLIDIV